MMGRIADEGSQTMSDFKAALAITLKNEGGYSNDATDAGGETYRGISRVYHPDWSGWAVVDAARGEPGFPDSLDDNHELGEAVAAFYKQQFWNRFMGDAIPDQALAEELFDTSVNMGVGRAVEFLQEGINLLNRNQQNYADIVVDGKFGRNTLGALQACLGQRNGAAYLLKLMNVLQGMHYIEYARRRPSQEKYMRGWLNRVTL
jgi:lysozyme family protein